MSSCRESTIIWVQPARLTVGTSVRSAKAPLLYCKGQPEMVSLGLQALRGCLHRPLLLLQAHVRLAARHSQEAWWGLVAGMGPTLNSQLREVCVDAGAARARALFAPGTWGWRLGCPSLVVAGVQHTFRKGWRQVSLWQGDCAAAVGRAPLDPCPWAEGMWPAPVDCWGAVCLQAAGAPCEPSGDGCAGAV